MAQTDPFLLSSRTRGQVSGTTSAAWLLLKTFLSFFSECVCARVSAYQTWVLLYPTFHFFFLLPPLHWSKYSHIKEPTEVREYKARAQSLLYIWRTASALDGSVLNPTLTAGLSFITWWFEPERNRGERKKKKNISNRLRQVNFLALSTLHICLPHHHHRHHHHLHLSLWPSRLLASRGSSWGGERYREHWSKRFSFNLPRHFPYFHFLSTLDVLITVGCEHPNE